jgi:hypothetical protein
MQTPEKTISSSSPQSPLSSNPLAFDEELQALVSKLDAITNHRGFRRWKGSFLRRFESFLTEQGIAPAQEWYQKFSKSMELFEKNVVKVKKFCSDGAISIDRVSVKGRNSLNEMTKQLTSVKEEMENLIPSTGAQEKDRGYTKYHLGCVLVRDGFTAYDRMIRLEEMLQEMKTGPPLSEVADKQQLQLIDSFSRQLGVFKDVINDLGLLEVAMKSTQFSGEDSNEIVFLDPKTGAIIEFPRSDCFSKGILSTFADAEGKERIREEERSRVEIEELLSILKAKFFS